MPQTVEVRFKGTRKAFFQWPTTRPNRSACRRRSSSMPTAARISAALSAVGDVAAKKCGGSCSVPSAPASGEAAPAAGDAERRRPRAPTSRNGAPPCSAGRPGRDPSRQRTASLRGDRPPAVVAQGARRTSSTMKVSDTEWQWDRQEAHGLFHGRAAGGLPRRWCASWPAPSAPASSCGRSVSATRRRGSAAWAAAAASTAAPPGSPSSPRSTWALAKDQHLSLNPSQISGGCGRLLCCLKYEHEFYVTARKRFPQGGQDGRDRARAGEGGGGGHLPGAGFPARRRRVAHHRGSRQLREEMEGATGGAVIAAPPARRVERPESRSRPERSERPRPEHPQRPADRPRAERPQRQEPRAEPAASAPSAPDVTAPEASGADAAVAAPRKRRRRRRRRGGGGAAGENTSPSGPAAE